MTTPIGPEVLMSLRPIQDELAGVLGLAAGDLIGVSLAIDFRVRTDAARGCFLGGLHPDFAVGAVEALGGRVVVEGTGLPSPVPGGAGVLCIADEVSSPTVGGRTFGFGPVALAPTADPSLLANSRRLRVVPGQAPTRSRLERAEHLRTAFSLVSNRMAVKVAPAIDWSILAPAEGATEAWRLEALGAMAATRHAVGSSLIALADELDDERIDQLGDGYVRAAELWHALAAGDWVLGPDLHVLERSCVSWMHKASGRPTRYAF